MEQQPQLFTVGQFAKLHNINKRTLHYYDGIGLFSPAHKGENGYRYYTYLQSATLEMLLTLRELNMSIEEIDRYLKNRSAQSFRKIMEEKTTEIDQTIKRLTEIRNLLTNQESQLSICEQTDLDRIEIVKLDEEYVLLSKSIAGTYDEADFAVLVEHSQSLPGHRVFNKSYGSMLSAEKILANKFDEYDCFFTQVEKENLNSGLQQFDYGYPGMTNKSQAGTFVKPSGNYVKAFCKGSWDKLPRAYQRIVTFAEKQGLTLKGFAYEEGMNEIAISSMDEYVTMIMILCE